MAIQDDLAKADKSKSAKKSTSSGSMYATKKTGVNSSAPKKSAVDKSGYNKNIKVSQAQIDAVKKLGMAGAIKSAGSMSPAMREAATRLYGAKRIGAASASKPAAKSADSARSAATVKVAPKKAAPKTGAAKPAYSTGSKTSTAKNPYGGFSMFARTLAGKNTSTPAYKAEQAKLKAAWDKAKAAKK